MLFYKKMDPFGRETLKSWRIFRRRGHFPPTPRPVFWQLRELSSHQGQPHACPNISTKPSRLESPRKAQLGHGPGKPGAPHSFQEGFLTIKEFLSPGECFTFLEPFIPSCHLLTIKTLWVWPNRYHYTCALCLLVHIRLSLLCENLVPLPNPPRTSDIT